MPSETTRLTPQSCNPRQLSVVSSEGSVVSSEGSVVSSEGVSGVIPAYSNPHDPPLYNPKINPRPVSDFLAKSPPRAGCNTVSQADRLPPVARPPQGAVHDTPFKFGDTELNGYVFRRGEDAAYFSESTGRKLSFDEAQRIATAQQMEMN